MLGTLLEVVHTIYDLGVLFVIFFKVGAAVFKSLLTPIIWIFTFLSRFFSNIINFEYIYEPPISFDPFAVSLINSIPLFSTLALVIVVAFYVLVLFKIFKILSQS